ncbi:MAG: ribosome small subunit-dependent GTPase A [Clostridia bacterium]|nr:ribosome small subunit-dependent GTPase A [Clostridia bacterium]
MENYQKGRVTGSVGGLFEVITDGEERRLFCRARGNLRRGEGRVLVGDRVTVEISPDRKEECVIAEIGERQNSLIRPPLANLDALYVVLAVLDPAPMPETTDKLLAIAEHNNIPVTVVLTKTDLTAGEAEELAALYRGAGYPVFCVSTYKNEGIDDLRAHIAATLAGGKIAAFAGASGVGKSSLINALFSTLALQTGEISEKIGRGKNTTRTTALYPVFGDASGGYLADTPGFSMLDFIRFDFMGWQDLPFAFREFAPYLGKCRYAD